MYSPAPFVWLITLLVAACFVVSLMVGGFEAKINGTLGLAALLWVLYCVWETFAFTVIDPAMLEVRVDLLMILPVLLVVTAVGL